MPLPVSGQNLHICSEHAGQLHQKWSEQMQSYCHILLCLDDIHNQTISASYHPKYTVLYCQMSEAALLQADILQKYLFPFPSYRK